jgi:hypothetical protein
VPLRVDEARVHAAEVVVGDPEPLARVGQEVGEEDVGPLDQAVEQGATGFAPEVDADAPLVAPDLLDDEVASRRTGNEPAGDQAADGVAEAGMLDLDDLGGRR